MGTDDQNAMDQGGAGPIDGVEFAGGDGDSLGDGDGVGEGVRLGEGDGMIEGDATMAGISFALFGVSFRTRSAGGFGLGVAGTATATEGVDIGLDL
jgi:hypothetical protein